MFEGGGRTGGEGKDRRGGGHSHRVKVEAKAEKDQRKSRKKMAENDNHQENFASNLAHVLKRPFINTRILWIHYCLKFHNAHEKQVELLSLYLV